VRSLLVATSDVTILSVTHSNSIATYILGRLLIEIENIALAFLSGVCSRGSNATWVVHQVDRAIDSTYLANLLIIAISHESFVVRI
jgi:hypothetical protein